jgi:hypothetical protein
VRNGQSRISQHATPELTILYDNEFGKLSERFYKSGAWPTTDKMSEAVDLDDNLISNNLLSHFSTTQQL